VAWLYVHIIGTILVGFMFGWLDAWPHDRNGKILAVVAVALWPGAMLALGAAWFGRRLRGWKP